MDVHGKIANTSNSLCHVIVVSFEYLFLYFSHLSTHQYMYVCVCANHEYLNRTLLNLFNVDSMVEICCQDLEGKA